MAKTSAWMARVGGAAILAAGLCPGLPSPGLAQTVVGGLPLPAGEVVDGRIYRVDGTFVPRIRNGTDANTYVRAEPPTLSFVGNKAARVIRTTEATQFVRFYAPDAPNGGSGPVGGFLAGSNVVRGLNAAQIKNVLALPFAPTNYTLVNVPAGTCILAAHGAPIVGDFPADPPDIPAPGPWGRGGTPQYYLVGKSNQPNCKGAAYIPDGDFFNRQALGQHALSYAPLAGRGNAGAVANALDTAPTLPPLFGDMDGVYNSLDRINFGAPGPLRGALVQLGGEIYADTASVDIAAGAAFLNILRQQMRVGRWPVTPGDATAAEAAREEGLRLWIAGIGTYSEVSGGAAHDLSLGLGGPAMGADARVLPDVLLGGALAYTHARYDTNGLATSGTTDTFSAALYGSFTPGAAYFDWAAGYAHGNADVTRNIAFPGVVRTATGEPQSNAFLLSLEAGYGFALGGASRVTPFAGFETILVRQNGFAERGAGAIDLLVDGQSSATASGLLGAAIAHRFRAGPAAIDVMLRAGWRHDFADTERTVTANFAGLPGAPFTVAGAEAPRDAAVLGASIGVAASPMSAVEFFATYDGLVSDAFGAHSGSIGLSWSF
ncbi:autotransporter outer membrane beta-barrel domain-containing protein [Acuticoccus sp. M5D2P5]|uniref:autotransporter outer membrane beta-barrel domain-containing protein n=1 Tax=Acuticoccus kalidii TaxID=2910977 RepID=UPI001F403D1D|nr:autotransporter outer membrane beta-barrel domain-containing protein [Acuticoccus kalidii]MCF3934377.1 autotransporter outer membrane beta-barrel domain-containing protein [Acuticoccus kalidii]